MQTKVVLSIGSNVGDSLATLQGAVDGLSEHPEVHLLGVSPVYETDPVGGPVQDAYLNAIVLAQTTLTARELLAAIHAIEAAWRRTRQVRWGPRTLDIDIITFGAIVDDDPNLTLPHPRAAERAFVLVPWLDQFPSLHSIFQSQ